MSRSTEESYVGWIRRYILFDGKRHPAEMRAPEVTRFLTDAVVRALTPEQLPAVLTRDEVRAILQRLVTLLRFHSSLRAIRPRAA